MKMFIHGEERDSRDSAVIEVVNPYNGKLLDTVPAATREDVTECITWAVEGQKTWNQKNIRKTHWGFLRRGRRALLYFRRVDRGDEASLWKDYA